MTEEKGGSDANKFGKDSQGFGLLSDLHTHGGSRGRFCWQEAAGGARSEVLKVRVGAGRGAGSAVPGSGVSKRFPQLCSETVSEILGVSV